MKNNQSIIEIQKPAQVGSEAGANSEIPPFDPNRVIQSNPQMIKESISIHVNKENIIDTNKENVNSES